MVKLSRLEGKIAILIIAFLVTGSIALIDVEGGDGDVDDQKSRQGPDDHNYTYDHYLHNDSDLSP